MRWLLVVAVLACACEKQRETVPSEVKRVEKKIGKQLDGVVLVRQGIYVDRVFATDTGFPDALAKAKPREVLDIWLLDDPEPATTVIGALQVVADKHPVVRIHHALADDSTAVLCRRATLSSLPATPDVEVVALSVLMTDERMWIGLSRVNEFQEIPAAPTKQPDFAKLGEILKQHKASAFFADRKDLELSAEPKVSSQQFAAAISTACENGWTELSMLRVEQISARPQL